MDFGDSAALSYEDTAYETQLPSAEEQAAASLRARIGNTKVYLLSDTLSTTRVGSKRKHDDVAADDGEDIDEDVGYRVNALLLSGSPIGSLPTASLFAYATHFDAHPLGLEWVDDERCVFVFDSKADARGAYRLLQKHITEEPDADGFVTAKPIPVAIWPAEDRINRSLGTGEGLTGLLRMRWARAEDAKQRGAREQSQFYRKHGWRAGKESQPDSGIDYSDRDRDRDGDHPAAKRRRRGSSADADRDRQRAALDAELDAFIQADDDDQPEPEVVVEEEPTSKMRSDYIASDGRTLLERTSAIRVHPTLESRLTAPLPRRARGSGMYADGLENGGSSRTENGLDWGRPSRPEQDWSERRDRDRNKDRDGRSRRDRDGHRRNGHGGREREREPLPPRRARNERPTVTREDLDAELDAFLEAKD
uniref:Chromatin target of PRMT1 protein C-terminal domain-containing protein n=1 Tax=Mycena chlorophos TaxID=658473 RepID=A0ABQ0L4M4_MYCCL|nr:predicted protein [Mycena chlorophos]